ncbi:GTP cyclohydrolase FolE2 [Paenibacillus provencensis]|uniref:GTP cyclohydrolase FolE2 n=1 Tax=Paenibacillus provencensis TaxID=441151 RepID=A0ABW3QAP5_9BACL|nr:GTP cyclohydrolase FolE2 [Paenibacillus sp. MER 78]MCM3130475.1 GTP cyclohydrolase FolE2 [Paenibacillus sp. MER 78]
MKPSNNRPILPAKPERHRRFGSTDPIPGNKPTTKEQMADLQNSRENYLFPIDHVGISAVKHPIQVHSDLETRLQTSIVTISLATSLHRESKGINMSRLTEQLERYRQKSWSAELPELIEFAQELANDMGQDRSELTMTFPWFYERSAPVTGRTGLSHAEASIQISYEKEKQPTITLGLRVAVTTLCPCSKEISEYSAHNQRGTISITAEVNPDPDAYFVQDWKTAFLEAAESNASCALHPILKRPDEKAVTENAYENPRFVEDMVRLVAADLYEMNAVWAFTVECRNEESIHLHDAVAKITYDKRKEEAAT